MHKQTTKNGGTLFKTKHMYLFCSDCSLIQSRNFSHVFYYAQPKKRS